MALASEQVRVQGNVGSPNVLTTDVLGLQAYKVLMSSLRQRRSCGGTGRRRTFLRQTCVEHL